MPYTITIKKPRYIINIRRGTQGIGLPAGGAAGEVATKASAADFDVVWLPPGAASVKAYLDGLPEYNTNEDAITGGLVPGDYYFAGAGHLSASAGTLLKVQ